MASLRASQLVKPGHVQAPPQHLANKAGLGEGQLPDVNPGSVSVVRKEIGGEKFYINYTVGGGRKSPLSSNWCFNSRHPGQYLQFATGILTQTFHSNLDKLKK